MLFNCYFLSFLRPNSLSLKSGVWILVPAGNRHMWHPLLPRLLTLSSIIVRRIRVFIPIWRQCQLRRIFQDNPTCIPTHQLLLWQHPVPWHIFWTNKTPPDTPCNKPRTQLIQPVSSNRCQSAWALAFCPLPVLLLANTSIHLPPSHTLMPLGLLHSMLAIHSVPLK